MSQRYSTGELAQLAQVTVRTVQYYDKRGILLPSELTEGGRRIYTESDLERLRLICFLRDMGFSIEQIKRVLAEENAMAVLELLLTDHIQQLEHDLSFKKDQLDTAVNLLSWVRKSSERSIQQLTDMPLTMTNRKALRRLQLQLIGGLVLIILLFLLTMYCLTQMEQTGLIGFWIALAILTYLCGVTGLMWQYKKRICYRCPSCHKTFEPSFKEYVLAFHTPKTRRLTCPHCHQKSYCLELAKDH